MQNWAEIGGFSLFALFMLCLLYAIIHMIYNRVKGKDELDDLFCFHRIINQK